MKEVAVLIGAFVAIILFFGWALSGADDNTELMCRQDCSEMSAEYSHHDMGVNGHTDRCSCKKDGNITPIW